VRGLLQMEKAVINLPSTTPTLFKRLRVKGPSTTLDHNENPTYSPYWNLLSFTSINKAHGSERMQFSPPHHSFFITSSSRKTIKKYEIIMRIICGK